MHNGQQKTESEVQEKSSKWIGRPVGNSGSRGDYSRYQDWYTPKESWVPNEVQTNGLESRLVFDSMRERVE